MITSNVTNLCLNHVIEAIITRIIWRKFLLHLKCAMFKVQLDGLWKKTQKWLQSQICKSGTFKYVITSNVTNLCLNHVIEAIITRIIWWKFLLHLKCVMFKVQLDGLWRKTQEWLQSQICKLALQTLDIWSWVRPSGGTQDMPWNGGNRDDK